MGGGLLYVLRLQMESPEKSAEDAAAPTPTSNGQGGGIQDLVLSLNFVPNWAKQSSAENPYADARGESRREESPRGERRDGGPRGKKEFRGPGGGRGPRSGGGGGGRRDERRGPGPGPGAGSAPQGDRGPRRFEGDRRDQRGRGGPRRDQDFAPRLPINVSLVPEKNHLGVVVKEIHDKRRAYPLGMLAGLFLQKPENFVIKFEIQSSRDRQSELKLWQNTKTGMVFLSRETAQSYAIGHDLGEFFERQDIPVEPPKGNFVCVGRCTLSGELLGPPNFHGYQEKLMELYRTRFSGMPLDVYRSKVEMVRDPAMVEQWKEQSKSVSRYREKTEPPGEAKLKRSEAEFKFLNKYAKDLFKQGQRFLMSGARAVDLPDPDLRRQVRDAWTRENRYPMTLLFALRAAFKHMRLELFKVGNETFATAIAPKPMDATYTVENIHTMIELLREHPGWTRKELVEHMQPGLLPESPEALELLNPLRWLIDKGHVIEFFNGTLSLPATPPPRPQHAEKVAEQPAPAAVVQEVQQPEPAPENPAAPEGLPSPAAEPVIEETVVPQEPAPSAENPAPDAPPPAESAQ